MLAEDVCRVDVTRDMMKGNNLGCNGFAYTVVGKGMPALVKATMWQGGAVDKALIVTKEVAGGAVSYTHLTLPTTSRV